MFSNLVGNALAYGAPDTPVRVVIDASGHDVRCVVHNSGPAIPSEILPILFDPFRRGNDSKTNKTQGLGLGLFISKQIVLSHGGKIAVDSSAAGGTQFTVTLPKTILAEKK